MALFCRAVPAKTLEEKYDGQRTTKTGLFFPPMISIDGVKACLQKEIII
jgi:hypothetical protein